MDIDAALKDGYTLEEVNREAARRTGFKYDAAKADGYSDDEINQELRLRLKGRGATGTSSPDYEAYKRSYPDKIEADRRAFNNMPQIPGHTFIPSEPMSYGEWLASDLNPSKTGRVIGKVGGAIGAAGEVGASLGTGVAAMATAIPGTLIREAMGKTTPGKHPVADYIDALTYIPRGKTGQQVMADIAPVLAALPLWGNYPGQLGALRKGKKPSVADTLARQEPTLEPQPPVETLPPVMQVTPEGQAISSSADITFWQDRARQLTAAARRGEQGELPLFTSPEAIAEMQGRGTGQPDMFFSDQANADALGAGGMQDARAASAAAQQALIARRQAAAQSIIEARDAAAQEEVARQVAEEQIARHRAQTLAQGAETLGRTDTGLQRHQEAVLAAETEAAGRAPMLRHQDVMDFTPEPGPLKYGSTETGGRIDEHGIPIRADLSMEAQQLQNPLQRNLWGDELPGKTGDGGKALTRALDSMPPGPERDAAIAMLKPPAPHRRRATGSTDYEGGGVGVGGPHGAQRGAINPRIFKDGVRFAKTLPNGLKLVVTGDKTSPKVQAFIGNEEVAHARFERDNWVADLNAGADNLQPKWVHTVPQARRGGIASEMYKFMASLGNDIIPDSVQSVSAKKMWDNLTSKGIAKDVDFEPYQKKIYGDPGARTPGIGPGATPGRRGITRGAVYFGPKSKSTARWLEGDPETILDPSLIRAVRTKAEAINDILGTKHMAPIRSAEDIIAGSMGQPDGQGSVNFSAGSTLEHMKRRSPLIRDVSRVVQHYKNVGEQGIRDFVFPFESAARRLSKDQIVDFGNILKQEMFNRKRYAMADLAKAGMDEKSMLAYMKLREMFSGALDSQNKARVAQGLKPITEVDAYLSSRWQGDFKRIFKDSNGKTVWMLAADSKAQLEGQTKALAKDFPGLTHEDHVVRSGRGQQGYKSIYTTMLDVLGDDPAVAKIKEWYEAQVQAETYMDRNQPKHFQPKGNVRGFVGDRPGTKPVPESLAMLQEQINYAKNAFKWSAMQHAALHLKGVLGDKGLLDTQPNNMRYAREYFSDQIGANEIELARAVDNTLRNLGMSPNALRSGVNSVKAIWVAQKLAVNLGFAASNVIQSTAMLPHLTNMQVRYGGNPLVSIPAGMVLGLNMATSHLFGQKGKPFYDALAHIPGINSEFIATAMKFAEDNGTIAKSVYDESPIGTSFGPGRVVDTVVNKTIGLPETYLRSIAYMTYVSQLKSSGKFKNDLELFRVADETVRASMGDYGEGEKAMIFNKMGNLGNAANVLQTYPINYFNQWSWASREAWKGNVLPFMVMFAVQVGVAGAMGIPGFTDADKAVEWAKDWLKEHMPLAWAKVKDFSLKDIIMQVGGESALYGVASPALDVALTSRAAAPSGAEMVQSPFAPAADLASQAGQVGKAVMDPMNPQAWAQAAHSVAPSGLQGALETSILKDYTSAQTDDGGVVYNRPSNMAGREGIYARTPREETLRALGLRSQKEQVTRDLVYRARKAEKDAADVVRKLPDKVWNELRLGRMDKATDLFKLHVALSGTEMSEETITKQIIQEYTTQAERMMTQKNKSLEALVAYKRFQKMLEDSGYATKP